MRGIPKNAVPCEEIVRGEACGKPGYPSLRRCNQHRPPSSTKKYFWTPQQEESLRRIYEQHVGYKPALSRELQAFARRLGWPVHALKNKAAYLGLTSDIRSFWTNEEIAFLREYSGVKPLAFLKEHLGRSYTSIRYKMDRLHLSLRVTDGYSRADLRDVFGVSVATVRQWIAAGWLRPSPETDRVPEAQVLRFIREHAEEYSLKRVDQAWFKGLLFPMFGKRTEGKRAVQSVGAASQEMTA